MWLDTITMQKLNIFEDYLVKVYLKLDQHTNQAILLFCE